MSAPRDEDPFVRKLFGTDGMRGEAGRPPLDPDTLYRLGRAVPRALEPEPRVPHAPFRIAIGMDPRESSPWITAALARGIRDAGGEPVGAGVMPTPALALITREGGFRAGLMVSASHNPYTDNGVKVFDATGSKLPDEEEARLERLMDEQPEPEGCGDADGGMIDESVPLAERYLAFLDRCLEGASFHGLRVVLDTAHGAAYRLAPEAFRRAGAEEVIQIGGAPNGRNINDEVGSLHPETLAAAVHAHGAHIGFSFDGDADRCIAVSPGGNVLDGDFMLYYMGRVLHDTRRLAYCTVVATSMSNFGLEKALRGEEIRLLRTDVGDRYVLRALREGGFVLGGEQSGHVILMHYAPTGDGILTALTLTSMWRGGGGDLDEALSRLPRYPQVIKNLRVREKPPIAASTTLSAAVRAAEEALAGDGRVVVRYSGTEPLLRVMVEGSDRGRVERIADGVVEAFRREIGAEEKRA